MVGSKIENIHKKISSGKVRKVSGSSSSHPKNRAIKMPKYKSEVPDSKGKNLY